MGESGGIREGRGNGWRLEKGGNEYMSCRN